MCSDETIFSRAADSRHIMNTALQYRVGNGKGKGQPMAYSLRYWGEAEVYLQPIRKSALGDGWSVSCSSRSNNGKKQGTHCAEGWVGVGACLEGMENVASTVIRSAERPPCIIVEVRAFYLSTGPKEWAPWRGVPDVYVYSQNDTWGSIYIPRRRL
jgi:hypothetical protein